jgi:hypothetical protein
LNTLPPDASGAGSTPPSEANIQQRIDALLITLRYAEADEKPAIESRINALQTALEYALEYV